jgi:hypothetical protein
MSKANEAAETFQTETVQAVDLPRLARPFRMRAITVGGKYLTHDNIVAVAEYFLECRLRYLRECLRVNMTQLTVLGHQFTAEEWRAALDPEDAEMLPVFIPELNVQVTVPFGEKTQPKEKT